MDEHLLVSQLLESGFALADAWRLQGRWREAYTLVQGLVPVAVARDEKAIAQRYLLTARILWDEATFGAQDTLVESDEALDQALIYAQRIGDPAILGTVWDAKGSVQHAIFLQSDQRKEPENELTYFEQGLVFRKTAEDVRGIAESLFHLGLVYGIVRRDHVQALPHLEESSRLAKQVGDLVTASYAIRHIGFAKHAAGDGDAAYVAMAESLHLREAAGFVPGVAMALHVMAYAEAEYGDKAKAIGCLERARSIFESLAVAKQVAWLTTELEQFQ